MNNRLHKLTDNTGLNYYSRQPGKPHPRHRSKHSPLLPKTSPPPALLTSRTRPPLRESRQESVDSNESREILIIEDSETEERKAEILIVDEEDRDEPCESIYQHDEAEDRERR